MSGYWVSMKGRDGNVGAQAALVALACASTVAVIFGTLSASANQIIPINEFTPRSLVLQP